MAMVVLRKYNNLFKNTYIITRSHVLYIFCTFVKYIDGKQSLQFLSVSERVETLNGGKLCLLYSEL